MEYIDLTNNLSSHFKSYPRTYGRYSASELYNIVHDKITPEEWINGKSFTPEQMIAMWRGSIVHEMVQKILKAGKSEVKVVVPKINFTIVGKCDFLPDFENTIWEFKTDPNKFELTDSERFQGKVYCSLFARERTIFYQPVVLENKLCLEKLGEEQRDDDWFDAQMTPIFVFHSKLQPLWEQYQDSLKNKQIGI